MRFRTVGVLLCLSMVIVFWIEKDARKAGEFANTGVIQVCSGSVPKHYGLVGLKNRSLLSHSSGAWKSGIEVWAGLVSHEASLLGLQMPAFALCSHAAFCPCTGIAGVSCCLVSTPVLVNEGPPPWPHHPSLRPYLQTPSYSAGVLGC